MGQFFGGLFVLCLGVFLLLSTFNARVRAWARETRENIYGTGSGWWWRLNDKIEAVLRPIVGAILVLAGALAMLGAVLGAVSCR